MTFFEPLNIQRTLPLRVEDFLLLNDTGAFVGYGKTELIDGGIIFVNAQLRPHARTKMTLERALSEALVAAALPYEALIEATVAMPPHNAPEPDIVVTNEPIGEGPIPLASVALIVEVSDTTLAFDLGDKQLLYARQAVPEYWVADVQGRVMHQMWQPGGRGYRGQRPIAFGAMIASESLVGLEVETDRL